MSAKFFEKLSNDYLELLDDAEDFNVFINVGEFTNVKIFKAHSAILRQRSLYFRNKLTNADKDENNIKIINLKKVSVRSFEFIIKYIYGGTILLEDIDSRSIFDLLLLAHEFLFEELVRYLETHLIETNSHWLLYRFSSIYQISFENNLQLLQKWCINIAATYPDKIFGAENFESLQENALLSLIKCNDLQMEEVKIWNNVIKWGIAQNPNLPLNLSGWSHENFLTLKTTLENCLPHIRYFQMSNSNIVNNVQPYYQILEKGLWDDILKWLDNPNVPIFSTILPARTTLIKILPHRLTEPFSTIISEEYAVKIASWVDKKADLYPVTNNPYGFRLLLIIVMKVNGSDEILGGYNPIGWDRFMPFLTQMVRVLVVVVFTCIVTL